MAALARHGARVVAGAMILLTGGAGFIGSNLHAALVARGREVVVVDRLRDQGKWRNLMTGELVPGGDASIAMLLEHFPVALLVLEA